MFTGIVEQVGKIKTLVRHDLSMNITVSTAFADQLNLGESVAVNGCCLTVAEKTSVGPLFILSPETLEKTNLKNLREGSVVNLERALAVNSMAGGRLSGHIVQGHVDGIATLTGIRSVQFSDGSQGKELTIELPSELSKYVVNKGSITIDGVSLTVNSVNQNQIQLMIIPHTLENTVIGNYQTEQTVNIEVDIIAKYVERLCKANS